jgi:alkylhydroperoxidase family enzyme
LYVAGIPKAYRPTIAEMDDKRIAWIDTIAESEATGLLGELYAREFDRDLGAVDNILKVHSLHPETLRAHIDLYRTIMYGRSGITRAERETVGVVVSKINACHY